MLANVQQRTIKPIITAAVAPGTLVHTDEYSIYARLPAWGYGHKTVCHGHGEYARDEDGDGRGSKTGYSWSRVDASRTDDGTLRFSVVVRDGSMCWRSGAADRK
jgi:hypothetical protein